MTKLRVKIFLSDTGIWLPYALSLLSLAGGVLLVRLRVAPTDELFILHYSIPFGIDLVGQWYELYYRIAFGVGVLVINFTLSFLLFFRYKVVSRAIALLTFFISAGVLIALFLLIRQNS